MKYWMHRGERDLPPSRLRVDAAAAGLRSDAFLARELPFLSRTRIRQKIQMGDSFLNGNRHATSTRLREGDEISLRWRGIPSFSLPPAFVVLYEDDFLLAVDKPAGVPSHPMGRRQSGTVIQFARYRYAEQIRECLGRGDVGFYPSLVNRLDAFTSGIVLVSKTRDALLAMQDLVTKRLVSREYIALVEGTIAEPEGSIDIPIGRDVKSDIRVKMAPRPDGRASVTRYRVRRNLPGHTLVSAFPLTGRQHQVRVHLAAIGHPVWGDLLYKDERLFLRYQVNGGTLDETLPPRQCLHAARVWFTHPMTGAAVEISAPLPEDFLRILAGVA